MTASGFIWWIAIGTAVIAGTLVNVYTHSLALGFAVYFGLLSLGFFMTSIKEGIEGVVKEEIVKKEVAKEEIVKKEIVKEI